MPVCSSLCFPSSRSSCCTAVGWTVSASAGRPDCCQGSMTASAKAAGSFPEQAMQRRGSVPGIVAPMPVGIGLALGRRSTIPLIRVFSVAFIEFWRGVPLITVLFFATYMLPLFVPTGLTIDGLVRALIGIALFAGAYQAEVIRGGLQAIPRGQGEAASSRGRPYCKTTGLIVMPQALRHVIPGLVNSFIALFKDTSLVSIVALFDLLGQLRASFSDPVWATPTTSFTGFAFTGMIYFAFCFGMSRYSLFFETSLTAHRGI